MKKHLPFVLAAVVPFLLLLGMAADQIRVVATGTPVRVPVVPVDPMSLFSGEYARLSFEFSTMDGERLRSIGAKSVALAYRKGDRAWVVLSPGADGLWHPKRMEVKEPERTSEKEVAVRGEVESFYSYDGPVLDNATNRPTGERKRFATLRIRTGLESFFVPEGEAAKIERAERGNEVSAELAVLPSGRAAVRKLFLRGKELHF